MTVTSPSDGAAGRRGAAGGAGREPLPQPDPSPRARRRESVVTLPPAPRSRQHARRMFSPEPQGHRRPGGSGVAQPSLFPAAVPVPAPPAAVRPPAPAPASAVLPAHEPAAGERWSREWLAARRHQRQARVGVGVALLTAAGLTVLALVTARSPTSAGQQTPSVVLTPAGPSVGTAGLVPAPQPPPAGTATP